jgi:outer membrane protein OmpA-like peptidoglycan-associated protein
MHPAGQRASRLGVLVVVGTLALAACARVPRVVEPLPVPAAAPTDLYVLLPSADGHAGALVVTQGATERVLDAPFTAARIKSDGTVETGTATEPEVKQVFGDALAALPPRPVSFTLYFLEGTDELTPDSKQFVRQVFDEIARRPAPEVLVIGHTDRVGSVQANDGLSIRRAERMRDELVKLGAAADRVEVSGRGEREPLVPTADEVAEPKNRRVEITVR